MSAERRLWVIDPSVSYAEAQGVREVLDGWTGSARVFEPARVVGDGPDPATGYDTDGVVLLGSAASIHDRDRWIRGLDAWLQPILAGAVPLPLLGICFGHQLVAGLAGGEVGFVSPDRRKELEIGTSSLDGGRLLPGPHELRVVISHREEVQRCPRDFRVTAHRPRVAVDGLEHRRLPIFTYQFHPEAREEFAIRAGLGESSIDERVRRDGRRVLGAFRELARKKSRRIEPPA